MFRNEPTVSQAENITRTTESPPAAGLEKLSNRLLRRIRWCQRFWRMLAAGVRGQPGMGAANSMFVPKNYEPLLSSLQLPDRLLPLTRFERMAPGEANTIARMVRRAASTVVENYCAAKQKDGSAFAMRDQHAKPHGCLQAAFFVRGDVPPELAFGVFQPNASYEAIVRFSNAHGTRQSDRIPDGRGMAIKLLHVRGRNILSPERSPDAAVEQDFLLTNFPVFFAPNVTDYTEFLEIAALPRDTWREKLKQAVRVGVFFLLRPRELWIFSRHALQYPRSPLHATYHSMTPYLLGDARVVRYRASPAQVPRSEPKRLWRLCDENFLGRALAAELRARRPPVPDKAVFDFSLQVRHAVTPDDVEDASRAWRRRKDRLIKVARIEIPLQDFDTPRQWQSGENLSFSPWHCLREHRPLGGLNRMRLAVYRASLEVRHRLNMVR
jgi:hypothetical protein